MSIGSRIKAAIFMEKAAGWSPPTPTDETIWGGGNYWGPGMSLALIDNQQQVDFYRGWNYVCVWYNARTVGTQKFKMYTTKKTSNAKTKSISPTQRKHLYRIASLDRYLSKAETLDEVYEHPWLDALKSVNPIMNKTNLWMMTEVFMGLTGKAFWWLRPNMLGVPYQVWTLEPYRMKPVAGETIDKYLIGWKYTGPRGSIIYDPVYIVFHNTPNPKSILDGMSPVMAMADPLITLDNMARWERSTFKNMARVSGVFSTDESLGEKQFRRLKKEIKKTFTEGNVESPAVLDGGLKFQETGMKPKDLAHIQGRKQMKEEVADGHGIPFPLLSPETANLASSKVAYHQYMRDTVTPKLRLYEEQVNQSIEPFFGDEIFCAFENAIPSDDEFELRQRDADLKTGFRVINELREEDGLDPFVEFGDKPIMPAGMVEFDPAQQRADKEAAAQQAAESARLAAEAARNKPEGDNTNETSPGNKPTGNEGENPVGGNEDETANEKALDNIADRFARVVFEKFTGRRAPE